MSDLMKVRVQLPHGSDPNRGPGWTDLWVREGTSDEDVIQECWILDVYHVRGLTNLKAVSEPPGAHEPTSVRYPRVLDIGSCTGIFTALVAQMYPDTQVIAVEPEAANQKIAAMNINERWADRIKIVPFAVGASSGWTAMLGSHGTGHTAAEALPDPGSPAGIDTVNTRQVQQITLEELIGGQPVALLKMDVEGAEYEIIDACPVEQLAHADLIHMEWHGPEMCPWLTDAVDLNRYGSMVAKLAQTHAVNVFGRPNVGGMLFAHRYPD